MLVDGVRVVDPLPVVVRPQTVDESLEAEAVSGEETTGAEGLKNDSRIEGVGQDGEAGEKLGKGRPDLERRHVERECQEAHELGVGDDGAVRGLPGEQEG
jgi:hypothetical protein